MKENITRTDALRNFSAEEKEMQACRETETERREMMDQGEEKVGTEKRS